MPVSLPAQETGIATVALGELTVEVRLEPLTITIRRGERTVIGGMTLFGRDGQGTDRLIDLTEGVIVDERLGPRLAVGPATIVDSRPDAVRMQTDGPAGPARLEVRIAAAERVEVELEPATAPFRLGAVWAAGAGEHLTGLGARHGGSFDQAGRLVRLGADRAYTGPDCPPEMLAEGGIGQGDYVPAPWLCSSAGWALWLETWGAGVELDARDGVEVSQRGAAGRLRMRILTDPTPAARLRHYLRLTGLPQLLPEWGYGHWKSRDVYAHQRDVVDDFEGYERSGMPLDAIVIDSPWETQYNTWRFNPHQFPDAARDDRADARGRGADRGLGHALGQPRLGRRTAAARPGVRAPAPAPGVQLRRGHVGRALPPRAKRRPARRQVVDGDRLPGRLQLAGGASLVAETGAAGARAGGRGNQGRRRRGLLHPARGPVRRPAHGRRRGLGLRRSLSPHDAGGPRSGPPRDRGAVRPLRLERPAGGRDDLGRRPGLGLLVAAGPGGGDADRGGERVLELVARRRRLPRQAPGRALPARAALALGAVRLLHPADAGPRPLRAGGVALRRPHARRLPPLRPPARAPGRLHPGGGGDRRPLRAADHPPAGAHRPRRRSRLGDRRLLRVRALALGRPGARAGSDRAPRLPAAGTLARVRSRPWPAAAARADRRRP